MQTTLAPTSLTNIDRPHGPRVLLCARLRRFGWSQHRYITECSSTLYLGFNVEFFWNNWVFDHGIIQTNIKRQKPTTRLQIDLHCLAVHKNTNKRTLEYP